MIHHLKSAPINVQCTSFEFYRPSQVKWSYCHIRVNNSDVQPVIGIVSKVISVMRLPISIIAEPKLDQITNFWGHLPGTVLTGRACIRGDCNLPSHLPLSSKRDQTYC